MISQDVILAVKQGLVQAEAGAAELSTASSAFLKAHKEVYGSVHIRPKHHWMLDLAAQVRRDSMIVDAFVVERQHLMVKSVAEPVKNLADYETSVMSSLVHTQLRSVRECKLGNELVGCTKVLAEVPSALVAQKVAIYGIVIAVGDVVLRSLEVATVVACAQDGLDLFLFVAPMVVQGRLTEHAFRCRRTEGLTLWRALDVQRCPVWRVDPDGSVLVIAR